MIPEKKLVLRVGHSPDADDAFMFYALANGIVCPSEFSIEHVVEGIQSLNLRALSAELHVTAISAAVYPLVAENYRILSCGASVGRNYGPIVTAPQAYSALQLKGKKIAVPGKYTTAYLLLRIFLDDFEPVFTDFQEVVSTVKSGKADAACVIHEGQVHFENTGFVKCLDVGELWFNRFSLPIPLGLDVVRKDIAMPIAQKINRALYDSIAYARRNIDEALEHAAKFGRGIPKELLRKFVGMYVNDDTEDLGEEGRAALEILFRESSLRRLLPVVGKMEMVTLPTGVK